MLGTLIKATLSRLFGGHARGGPGRGVEQLLAEAAAHQRAGALDRALACLTRAVECAPAHAPALYALGVLQARTGDLAAARRALEHVVQLAPRHVEALNALGNLCRLSREWDAAMRHYRRAVELDGRCAPARGGGGGGGAAARRPARRAGAPPARCAPALSNLGVCLKNEGRAKEARTYLERACAIDPGNPEMALNLGLGLVDLGENADGERYLRQALALAPQMAEVHLALAFQLLRAGRFEEGWREYEWRRGIEEWERRREYVYPRWRGEPLAGRVIVVRGEQGLGDQIMFASCLPEVIAQAARTIVECDPRLKPLFVRSFPHAEIWAQGREGADAEWRRESLAPDYQVDIGSLPGILGRGVNGFPQHHGYLRADPEKTAQWRARLSAAGAPRALGISWRGGTQHSRRTARSVALQALMPLLRTDGIRFVSLQYGDCADEISAFSREHGIALERWQSAIDDYDETAALVAALDGVVSVQTAVVHLAGALGKPAWVMIPTVPEWRYLARGERMAWYPTVRLYRQHDTGDWHGVVARIAADLESVSGG